MDSEFLVSYVEELFIRVRERDIISVTLNTPISILEEALTACTLCMERASNFVINSLYTCTEDIVVIRNLACSDFALEVHLPPTFENHLQSLLTYPQGDALICHLISCHSPIIPKEEKKTSNPLTPTISLIGPDPEKSENR